MLELSGRVPACELSLLPFPQCSETAPVKPDLQCQPIKETFSVTSPAMTTPNILTIILCSPFTGVVTSTVTYHLTHTEHSNQRTRPSLLTVIQLAPTAKPSRLHCNAEWLEDSALHNTVLLTTCIQTG